MEITRIRINLKERELELQGSEAFIEKYQTIIGEFIERIRNDKGAATNEVSKQREADPVTRYKETPKSSEGKLYVPELFGEFYAQFPRNAKVVDKMLIAGYFVQMKSEDALFTPSQAAELLNEQNVNITNANAFIKSLQNTGKLYKQAGKFKIHEKGIDYISQLISQKS